MAFQSTLDFLTQLKQNNDRMWFEAHKLTYQSARGEFEGLLGEVIARFEPIEDLGGLQPSECIYRINRDVRFSKDKTPYKTNFGAIIGRGGRKGQGESYYLQIEPGSSMIAGGLYMPSSQQLDKMRREIVDDARTLREIVAAPDFVRYFGGLQGDSLKVAPLGYSKDHPDIDLLRRKQFMAVHDMTDAQVTAPDLADHILAVCAAMKPFVAYLTELVGNGLPG